MAIRKAESEVIDVLEVQTGELHFHIVGTSPLVLNRMSEKAKHELLMPAGRKTAADKAANLKHNPPEEFRASPYTLRNDDAPTFIAQVASAFKGAMGTAALDLPGAKKAQIGRLVYVHGDLVPIYGEPQLFMSVTRSADMNRTPDIRTRVIVPQWACQLRVTFVQPILRDRAVINLLAAAGMTAGIGDWRPEKGKGSYGQFRISSVDDPEYLQITQAWGRAPQLAAMEEPVCYDTETEEMLSWFISEAPRRGFKTVKAA